MMFIPAVLPLQEERFGSIDMISPWFDFDYTDYYYKEMGSSLFRRVMVFKDLIGQESLVTLKPNLAIESPITLDHVLAGRDMILDEEKETDFDLVWQVVSTVVTQSLAALTAMRANEAENLAGDLEERMTLIEGELKTIEEHRVAIKGPLATPVGRGMRSLNVRIRQELDLYACIRPVRYFSPVQSPVKHPEKVDITVFRENTEDLYAGIEWSSESEEVEKLTAF
ncbi:MAG: DUF4416 family protein, partial [Desulfobacteraceae bacterium]|nr:DUF4416 family protein [Desulfobacteraceae bacterium]